MGGKQQKIALLLTDMVMPESMTGLDLAARLKNEKRGLKAVISSGYSADLTQSKFAADPQITFLPKPYKVADLAKVVRLRLDTA